MAARVEQAGIAGPEPAVLCQRGACGLVLLVVTQEHAGALDLHLALIGDAYLRVRHGPPDGIGIGLVVALQGDEAAGFGRAVDLLEVDAKRAEEPEGVGAQRGTAREARPRIAQTQLVAHGAIDQYLAQPVAKPRPCRDRLAVGLEQLVAFGELAEVPV